MKTTMKAARPMNARNTMNAAGTMRTAGAIRVMDMTEAATPSRTLAQRLAAWAETLMTTAHTDVRRYEEACAALGTGTNPREDAHDPARAARAMLYAKYFADSLELN